MTDTEQIKLDNIANTDNEIIAFLKQRYSPRIFSETKIENEHIAQLFEAVRWSASSNNLQPWRFIYAEKNSEAYDRIYNCLSDFNKKWANNAPLLVLTAYKEKTDDGKDNFHALHDLGLCLGNMTVQAQYMGIGLHHMAGVDWEKAHKEFNVPKGYHITTAIALGYYGGDLETLPEDLQQQETAQRTRQPIASFAYKDGWK
ncbi:nitroreductase family protein [Jejuia pallidilutea]|uniref:Nitroreductase n=1 Tax=Jejuia pallidilutea TaxID=504487 RepID=A0A090WLK8_9FLAO|nr:nitroreductase family protein [Jejuia pallidilutea]PQV47420.1 nitroreductase [Jejuia pallidilutea]GAL68352.1 oxygen-insensitive NADPH nitroreductase [Jejuia pallidilutea]GAL73328.1 oxygen-insensitive NADPH nitroreductase [Jejuia pallidilutea]GAL89525.1 oxygen-insensitive NADPH nitroreductase [Jejuia pallidilutea]